ncbi:MAG: diaminopimelate epimerase [Bacteroidales bacterium]|nr:diaminopimelate epimerase [Bacteroidales bacterium]
MHLDFSKYHGTGNDFIMVDGRDRDLSFLNGETIRILCHRRFGIGADGLILLMKSDAGPDFRMRYFNADGNEATMCGNGGRCIAAFAHDLGIISGDTVFESIDGIHEASILPDQRIRLKLNDVNDVRVLEDGYFVDTGSPHFVKFVEQIDAIPVYARGRQIRSEERFKPGGVNVNFAETVQGTNRVRVRTFERGVEDETLSCGTGVTASAISSYLHNKSKETDYLIITRGGELEVSFRAGSEKIFTDIFLTGPVAHVFDGTLKRSKF